MRLNVLYLVILILIGVQFATSDYRIGCLKCHSLDEEKINVHLVPHSHDDVGWLKTVEQYFYGLRTQTQRASVLNIISSVVEALSENPNRRFIQVETAFFWKWWKLQDDETRQKFKSLVDNGQIEMVNGAWSMNDEACTNYQSTIDQFTWGLSTIQDTIGTCGIPRIGWQIDPFGHSREQASLLAQFGYDAMFFARLDHSDRAKRRDSKDLEFAWQGSANLDNSVIFGGVFPTSHYSAPGGFCWDFKCNDPQINADPDSFDYNVDTIVKNFEDVINSYATYVKTRNILIPMGDDFQYEDAERYYINIDRLIGAFKGHPDIKLVYSTPSCYIKAVNDEAPELVLKTDDFFPYSDQDHSFWTGYFTSRPNSKRFERIGHNILQVTKHFAAYSQISKGNGSSNSLQYLHEIMGIMQHHDAITGTAKQHVVDDYVRLITQGIVNAEEPMGETIGSLLQYNKSEELDINLNISSCLLTNVSVCSISQDSQRFIVVVYNPLSWKVTHYIRLPVENSSFVIEGPDGKEDYDIMYPIPYFSVYNSQADFELVFAARDIPPMGLKLYYITKNSNSSAKSVEEPLAEDDDLIFGDNTTSFQIDRDTNLLKSVTMNGITLNITQNFFYYISSAGVEGESTVPSGAYLFRPNKTTAESLNNGVTNAGFIKGTLVDEFHQKWNDEHVNVSQIIRLYKNENYIEFDWLVGGINIDDALGKEVISRISVSNFNNDQVFYTDANGREMVRRAVGVRETYPFTGEEPVAGNYYPVTSKIVIKDEYDHLEVALLNDRSQGGSSLALGELELMVHRRLLHDDAKGVGESLNETESGSGIYVRGSHYLVIGSDTKSNSGGKTTAAQERTLAQKKLVQPWVGLAAASDSLTYKKVKDNLKLSFSALVESLPENINILTFEPWKNGSYILRFEHILEQNEDPVLSQTTEIDIASIFKNFGLLNIRETTLGANQDMDDYLNTTKYRWNYTGYEMNVVSRKNDTSEFLISLTPMQIRTFIVEIAASTGYSIKPLPLIMLYSLVSLHYWFLNGCQ